MVSLTNLTNIDTWMCFTYVSGPRRLQSRHGDCLLFLVDYFFICVALVLLVRTFLYLCVPATVGKHMNITHFYYLDLFSLRLVAGLDDNVVTINSYHFIIFSFHSSSYSIQLSFLLHLDTVAGVFFIKRERNLF